MLRNALERATHPSPQQIAALLQYLEKHPEVARGFPKLPAARNKIRKHWELLAPRLNSVGRSVKTWQQWTKYWADKKLAVRRKAALRAAAVARGGHPDLVVELSDLEQHILALGAREHAARPRRAPGEETAAGGAPGGLDAEVVLPLQEEPPQPQSPAASPSPPRSSSPPAAPAVPAAPPARHSGSKPRRRGRAQRAGPTERFLALEERRLELERRNAGVLETLAGVAGQLMERDFERERVFAQALRTVGDGLRLLAEALRRSGPQHGE